MFPGERGFGDRGSGPDRIQITLSHLVAIRCERRAAVIWTQSGGRRDSLSGNPSWLIWLFTDDGVALGVGVQSSEERHAGRFLLALGETGTGGGDAGRGIHLVRAHCGSGIGVRCDHLDVAALLAQGLDLACQVCARKFAQALELACRVCAPFRWCPFRPPNGESTTTFAKPEARSAFSPERTPPSM